MVWNSDSPSIPSSKRQPGDVSIILQRSLTTLRGRLDGSFSPGRRIVTRLLGLVDISEMG